LGLPCRLISAPRFESQNSAIGRCQVGPGIRNGAAYCEPQGHILATKNSSLPWIKTWICAVVPKSEIAFWRLISSQSAPDKGGAPAPPFLCVPSMNDSLEVEVLYPA